MPSIATSRMDPVLPALRWDLGDVRIAFSCIADGDLKDPVQRRAWLQTLGLDRCDVPHQEHGSRVRCSGEEGAADGIVAIGGGPLGVFGADCPGLVIATPTAIGIAHCGWRGVAAAIVGHLVERLEAIAPEAHDRWRAFVGPGIAGARYEVDEAVLSARVWPAQALGPARPGRALLDLHAVIAADLAVAGVTRLVHAGICTAGDPRLHSFRHQGRGPTQLLAAWRV